MSTIAPRDQKNALESLALELPVVMSRLIWMLGTKKHYVIGIIESPFYPLRIKKIVSVCMCACSHVLVFLNARSIVFHGARFVGILSCLAWVLRTQVGFFLCLFRRHGKHR